jgi:hypothetical protein
MRGCIRSYLGEVSTRNRDEQSPVRFWFPTVPTIYRFRGSKRNTPIPFQLWFRLRLPSDERCDVTAPAQLGRLHAFSLNVSFFA